MILNNMKHFINLKDIKTKDLRNIIKNALFLFVFFKNSITKLDRSPEKTR